MTLHLCQKKPTVKPTNSYMSACFTLMFFPVTILKLIMQQLNSSNSSLSTPVSAEYLIQSVVMAVCFILGVSGNIGVMVRLAGWMKGGSFTPRLMLSLAISDLLTLLFLPFWIWSLLHDWVFGLVVCKLFCYLIYLGHYSSILCVILMSMQRYMQVLHPETWNKLGSKGKKITLSAMWILSGILSCYSFVQHTVKLNRNGYYQCSLNYGDDVERVCTLIWEMILFVVLFPTLFYFYFHLYRGVNNTAFFRSRRLTKLVTRIVTCFFIFWVPLLISNMMFVIALLRRNKSLLRSAESADNITTALTFINSCVNPFLYAFSARALRQHKDGTENI